MLSRGRKRESVFYLIQNVTYIRSLVEHIDSAYECPPLFRRKSQISRTSPLGFFVFRSSCCIIQQLNRCPFVLRRSIRPQQSCSTARLRGCRGENAEPCLERELRIVPNLLAPNPQSLPKFDAGVG